MAESPADASLPAPRKAKRPSSAQQGYGFRHRELRRLWALSVVHGNVECARCGELIGKGEDWDLGHDDWDRRVYAGPEHRRCNRATQGRMQPTSRIW